MNNFNFKIIKKKKRKDFTKFDVARTENENGSFNSFMFIHNPLCYISTRCVNSIMT